MDADSAGCKACWRPVSSGVRRSKQYCDLHQETPRWFPAWVQKLDSASKELLYSRRGCWFIDEHLRSEMAADLDLLAIRRLASALTDSMIRPHQLRLWADVVTGASVAATAKTHGAGRNTVKRVTARIDQALDVSARDAQLPRSLLRDWLLCAALPYKNYGGREHELASASQPTEQLLDEVERADHHGARWDSLQKRQAVKVLHSGLLDLLDPKVIIEVAPGLPDAALAPRRVLDQMCCLHSNELPPEWRQSLDSYIGTIRWQQHNRLLPALPAKPADTLKRWLLAISRILSRHKTEGQAHVELNVAHCTLCGSPAYSAPSMRRVGNARYLQPKRGHVRCAKHLHVRRQPRWADQVNALADDLAKAAVRFNGYAPTGKPSTLRLAYEIIVTRKIKARDYAVGLLLQRHQRSDRKPPALSQLAQALGVSVPALSKRYGRGKPFARNARESMQEALIFAARAPTMFGVAPNLLGTRQALEYALIEAFVPPPLRPFLTPTIPTKSAGPRYSCGTVEVQPSTPGR